MSDVTWLPIPWAAFYQVSSDGRVRSVDRKVPAYPGTMRTAPGVELVQTVEPDGYRRLAITDDSGKKHTPRVHSLICETFHGPRPTSKHEVRHLNGIRTDNRAENLAWGTRSENMQDALRHGTHPQAKKTHCPRGHRYDDRADARVHITKNGHVNRYCIKCRRKPPHPPRLVQICSINGCGQKGITRGWCVNHYQRWRRWGNPELGRRSPRQKGAV